MIQFPEKPMLLPLHSATSRYLQVIVTKQMQPGVNYVASEFRLPGCAIEFGLRHCDIHTNKYLSRQNGRASACRIIKRDDVCGTGMVKMSSIDHSHGPRFKKMHGQIVLGDSEHFLQQALRHFAQESSVHRPRGLAVAK